jgi:hypothetical protein
VLFLLAKKAFKTPIPHARIASDQQHHDAPYYRVARPGERIGERPGA